MPTLALLALLLTGAPDGDALCRAPLAHGATATPTRSATDSLRGYWEAAIPYPRFLEQARRRVELWRRNTREGEVPGALLARARDVGGTWRLLAVSVDGCSDSVNTVPYLALLADSVPGLELRVLDPERGRPLMEARPTADGRAATPTVVLLDEGFEAAGCFIERPRPLKAWIEEKRHEVGAPTLYEGKMLWYDRDAGRSTLEEVVALLEAASAGEPICRG